MTGCIAVRNETLTNEQNKLDGKSTMIVVLLFALACFVVTTNLALVIGLRRTNKQLAISQKLYSYLSMTDSIIGIICLPYFAIVNVFSTNNCKLRNIGSTITVYSFGVGLGTFAVISILRNIAIRKPLYVVKNKIIYLVLIVWHVYVILGSLLSFFTYEPTYSSKTLSRFSSVYAGVNVLIQILIIVTCNLWSRRALTKQKPANRSENEKNQIEEQKRKRNQKAAGILSAISVVYVLCTLPLSLFYILLGVLLMFYERNAEPIKASGSLYRFIHLPVFLCSGFNALVYMLKDKEIKKYYARQFCCKRRNLRPEGRVIHSTVQSTSVINDSFNLG